MRLEYLRKRDKKIKLMLREPDISPESLGNIQIPVLVLAGEKDLIREEHTRLIAESIPHSTLQILPGESHGSYVVHSERLYPLLKEFLDNQSGKVRLS